MSSTSTRRAVGRQVIGGGRAPASQCPVTARKKTWKQWKVIVEVVAACVCWRVERGWMVKGSRGGVYCGKEGRGGVCKRGRGRGMGGCALEEEGREGCA